MDVATRFTWAYGLTSLSSTDIIGALVSFRVAAGKMPRKFHSDFDKKLMGGQALCWIQEKGGKIIAAPARRQSSNGPVERTWQTMVCMARSFIIEKQVGREFWFFAIKHAAHMLNQVAGRLGRKLTSPFELVYGEKPDAMTWFELFSVGYFPVERKSGKSASVSQAQTMDDGIAVGRDDQSNTVLFYNPITKKYYSPPIFKLDQSHLPVMLYPHHIRFDEGFVCGPLCNRTDLIAEPFPPGTRVFVTNGDDKIKGTIQNVPILLSPFIDSTVVSSADGSSTQTTYTILLDDGTIQLSGNSRISLIKLTPNLWPLRATLILLLAFQLSCQMAQKLLLITMAHSKKDLFITHRLLAFMSPSSATFDLTRSTSPYRFPTFDKIGLRSSVTTSCSLAILQ